MREYMLHISGSILVAFSDDDTIPVTAAEVQELFEDCAVNAYDLYNLHLRLEPHDSSEPLAPEAVSQAASCAALRAELSQLIEHIDDAEGLRALRFWARLCVPPHRQGTGEQGEGV